MAIQRDFTTLRLVHGFFAMTEKQAVTAMLELAIAYERNAKLSSLPAATRADYARRADELLEALCAVE